MFKDIIKRPRPGRPHLPAIPICCFSLKRARSSRRGLWGCARPLLGTSIAAPAEKEAGGSWRWEPPRAHGDRDPGASESPEGGRERVAVLLGLHKQHTGTFPDWEREGWMPRLGGSKHYVLRRQEERTRTRWLPLPWGQPWPGKAPARHRQSGFFNVWSFPWLSSTDSSLGAAGPGWLPHPPSMNPPCSAWIPAGRCWGREHPLRTEHPVIPTSANLGPRE